MRTLAGFPNVGVVGGHDFGQVRSVHLRNRPRLGHQLLGIVLQGGNHAAHHAVVAQMAHQGSSVNFGQNRNLELLQIFFGYFLGSPVGADFGKFANDQPLDIGPGGFVVFGVGPVIANLRVGENDNLPAVGRIGEDFLIAGDGSIKNYFPVTFAFGAVAFAAEDSTVFQRKNGLHSCSREWIL